MEQYEEADRGGAWVVFSESNPSAGIFLSVGVRGIFVESAVEGVSAGDIYVSWEQIEQARQRAIELEEDN